MSTQSGSLRWVRQEVLAGDASTRRYERLWDAGGRTAVRARYPLADGSRLVRDLEIAAWLGARGLRVPTVVAVDRARASVVLEDFGPEDAEQTLREAPPSRRPQLAAHLVEPLRILAAIEVESLPEWNPRLDRDRLRWELAGFEMWFLGVLCGVEPPPQVVGWLDELVRDVATHPRRVCHRDYHLNNLFLLPTGVVGVIDAQDVLIGPDTYDAVSLLAERSMPETLSKGERRAWLEEWASSTEAKSGWWSRWRLVRAQRGLKVLGTFARLCRCGRSEYADWMRSLAVQLAADLEDLDAPHELRRLLLHWWQRGGQACSVASESQNSSSSSSSS